MLKHVVSKSISTSCLSPATFSLKLFRPSRHFTSSMLSSRPAQYFDNARYEPRQQAYWHANRDGEWQSIAQDTSLPRFTSTEAPIDPKSVRLISWNIDMSTPFAKERMGAALQSLYRLVDSTSREVPIIIFLQEMISSDLEQIRESQWIKQLFNITDFDTQHWRGSYYGTTTLIDRRLNIQGIFRVPWYSGMDRDGLFVDLAMSNTQYPDIDAKTFRLCNVHLESLAADPPIRPVQLAAAAQYLNKVVYVLCALMAGDLNAIQPFDRTLHLVNDLSDAYLELGGQEDSDDGYTWGPQAQRWSRERYGCCRMDKVLFSGSLRPKNFSRIGMGVTVADDVLEEVEQEVEGGFVTDHYGIMGDFELMDGWELAGWDGGSSVEIGSRSS